MVNIENSDYDIKIYYKKKNVIVIDAKFCKEVNCKNIFVYMCYCLFSYLPY